MSIDIPTVSQLLEFNRNMTLKMLDEIGQLNDPLSALAFRPGPQRAHIAWQLMHVAITEELFATDRLRKTPSDLTDWFAQFQKGSIADNNIPLWMLYEQFWPNREKTCWETMSLITEAD